MVRLYFLQTFQRANIRHRFALAKMLGRDAAKGLKKNIAFYCQKISKYNINSCASVFFFKLLVEQIKFRPHCAILYILCLS